MEGIKHGEGGGTTFDASAMPILRLTMMARCLGMEIKGLRMVRHSVYAQAKRELGFRGNKESVLQQLLALIRTELQASGATREDIEALVSVGSL
jgi:hypothetical protein